MTRSEPDWSEITAVFGGTFDPPHLGHLEAMQGLLKLPGVKQLRVIPAGNPALKSTLTPAADRLQMLKLLVQEAKPEFQRRVLIDDREIRGSGPSYTADTLESLSREIDEIAFVIGTDQLKDLPRWNRFPQLLSLCHWIVMKRQPENTDEIRASLAPLLQSNLIEPTGTEGTFRTARNRTMKLVTTQAPAISSTGIRREIALRGHPPAGALSPEVDRYLKEKRLYGTSIRNDDKG